MISSENDVFLLLLSVSFLKISFKPLLYFDDVKNVDEFLGTLSARTDFVAGMWKMTYTTRIDTNALVEDYRATKYNCTNLRRLAEADTSFDQVLSKFRNCIMSVAILTSSIHTSRIRMHVSIGWIRD